MDSRLTPGNCKACGDPQTEDSRRVTLLLLDGHPMTLTLHLQDLPELDLNALWKVLIEAEYIARDARKGDPKAFFAHQQQLRRLSPPLGILFIEPAVKRGVLGEPGVFQLG